MDADYRSSLWRRLRAVHSLDVDACATMTLEQVNRVAHASALPIAFSLVHQLLLEDGALVCIGGTPPLFNEQWATRLDWGVPDHGKERSVEVMMHQRLGDYEAFRAIQALVSRATEDYVATVDPATPLDVLVAWPYPASLAHTFAARVGGQDGFTRGDALECWICQRALRHMGEIEHARARRLDGDDVVR